MLFRISEISGVELRKHFSRCAIKLSIFRVKIRFVTYPSDCFHSRYRTIRLHIWS